MNWEEINDNSDGAREALDASLFGSLLQKLYFPSIPVHPVCVTAYPLGSRAGEKPERNPARIMDRGPQRGMFVMQEAPLSETLGWRLAWKQITACPPCGWCLMGEMIQPGCCVIRAHAVRSTFPLLNPTKISQWTSNSVTRHDHIDLHLFKTPPFSVTFRPHLLFSLLHRCICNRRTWYCDRPPGYLSGHEGISHNYLAMQHIIQSSVIQTSTESSHPSDCLLPSQQILVAVGGQGKGLSGCVSALAVCVCVFGFSLGVKYSSLRQQ